MTQPYRALAELQSLDAPVHVTSSWHGHAPSAWWHGHGGGGVLEREQRWEDPTLLPVHAHACARSCPCTPLKQTLQPKSLIYSDKMMMTTCTLSLQASPSTSVRASL